MADPHSFEPSPWHAPPRLLEAYAHLDLDLARSASIERHLLTCEACRGALTALTRDDEASTGALDALWFDVIDAVDRPRPKFVGRVLHRLGVSDRVAVVVAATPALRLSWIASVLVALAFAVGNAMRTDGSDALLLVIAPLIPLLGIGTAYGVGVDPLYEVARAAPLPGSRVFLYRSVAVLVTALPITLLASLALRVDGLVAISWLLPALGLVGATMALATWMQPRLAALAAGSAWIVLLAVLWMRSARLANSSFDATFAFRPAGQLLFASIAVIGGVLFAARVGRLDQPDDVRMERI